MKINKKIDIIWCVVGLIAMFVFIKSCEEEPKTITKTEIKTVVDTIVKTQIQKIPQTVYVEKVKTLKGDTIIIHKDKPSETTITANQYQTEIKSKEAKAVLNITTTGELLDVQGTIQYPEKTITETIIKNKSGGFLYLETQPHNPTRFELGLDYQIKNKLLLGVSADYNNINQKLGVNFKVGIRIF